MECRSSSCLAFIRDAFIIFHQQFLGTKAYTHFCSPSAIVPFATLRDIEQPFLPQLGLSNLWVTGNSSQTGLIVSNLWPYAMRAARGPRWETLPGDVRPFCSFPVLWAGTHGSPLVVNVSGTLCSWRCFILGSLCATLVFQAYQAGRHVFWHSLIVFGAWKFVGEPGLGWVAAYIALNLVSIWWCFQCADRWQQPGTDKLRDLMRCWCRKRRKPSKGTLNRQKTSVFLEFLGEATATTDTGALVSLGFGPHRWPLPRSEILRDPDGRPERCTEASPVLSQTSPAWPVSRERCTACGGDTLPGGKRWRRTWVSQNWFVWTFHVDFPFEPMMFG